MNPAGERGRARRVPLSHAQRNIYHGTVQNEDPLLYLIGRRYRFRPVPVAEFMGALRAAILANPIQLCVLSESSDAEGYPDFVARLGVDDIVFLHREDPGVEWDSDTGIFDRPLVRYDVHVGVDGRVHTLEVRAHHIMLDGGAIGIIEADLGSALAGHVAGPRRGRTDPLADVIVAHRREASRIDESRDRLTARVRRELTVDGYCGDRGGGPLPGVAKGVLVGSASVSGTDFDEIMMLADRENVAPNVLVAAAVTAVEASIRQITECILVHAVDNRFGDADLDVATCLVNSLAQQVRFAPYASVGELVSAVDRGYVVASRRRWLREEQYRRMFLAVNRTTSLGALTLNFLRAPQAAELAPFLIAAPVTTDIGPVEGPTVAAVLDEQERTLTLNIWDRGDEAGPRPAALAGRIASALAAMAPMWDRPVAMTVGEWRTVSDAGTLGDAQQARTAAAPAPRAWFLARPEVISECRSRRGHVDSWISWLLRHGIAAGDVVVFVDDHTDATIDLVIACHLAGCGYSACDRADQVAVRATRIAEHGIATHIVDIAAARAEFHVQSLPAVAARVAETVADPTLAAKTAYVMPTSGSTGEPKLVHVSHGSLATFGMGMVRAYGWTSNDTVMQCVPLTSDISVEEIFGAALGGARLVRSHALSTGDALQLADDLVAGGATIIDLPTAVWHLWAEDPNILARVVGSGLRQIVVGGEPIRPAAVDKWITTGADKDISVVSSYGPTEATVVVTYLPIIDGARTVEHDARRRLGRPVVAGSVVIAFGEIVVVGDMVAQGYLGSGSGGFGTVATAEGRRHRAYATGDRVTIDDAGHPLFAGRRDSLVKIAGKRVDIAEITRRIVAIEAVVDVAVELHDDVLTVWFATGVTRAGGADPDTVARIKIVLAGARVPAFAVSGTASIPRKPSGKIDLERLAVLPVPRPPREGWDDQAKELAEMWTSRLGRSISPDTSLLHEGVGSLALVRILPDTREYLGRHVSILDLIAADTAAHLVADLETDDHWLDPGTVAEIDLAERSTRPANVLGATRRRAGSGPVVVVGAAGILGTGFAREILELVRSGAPRPELVLATRTAPPSDWKELVAAAGIRSVVLGSCCGPDDVADLVRQTRARTVINCIGNTNVVVPYHELRPANVDTVTALSAVCAAVGSRLVHLSTYVVNAEPAQPRVVDPRHAPYPYAATKALAELTVARAGLDATIVRLPRILGTPRQVHRSADILASISAACRALQAYPAVELAEHVSTADAAARAILGRLPEFGGPGPQGCTLDVVRGDVVEYQEALGAVARDRLDVHEWKRLLDRSDWAAANPRRWAVLDAWVSLGLRLGGRSYADYLAEYPTLPLDVETVREFEVAPMSVSDLLDDRGTRHAHGTTNQVDTVRQ